MLQAAAHPLPVVAAAEPAPLFKAGLAQPGRRGSGTFGPAGWGVRVGRSGGSQGSQHREGAATRGRAWNQQTRDSDSRRVVGSFRVIRNRGLGIDKLEHATLSRSDGSEGREDFPRRVSFH